MQPDWADEKATALLCQPGPALRRFTEDGDPTLLKEVAAALREAHEAGRREGIGEAVGIVDASADELRNAADQWDVRCVGQDAERIGADYRAREQHDRFLATAIRALAEEGRE